MLLHKFSLIRIYKPQLQTKLKPLHQKKHFKAHLEPIKVKMAAWGECRLIGVRAITPDGQMALSFRRNYIRYLI